ncbi:MAG: DUF3738 domain-containing protein [Terracidiphilus sp.]
MPTASVFPRAPARRKSGVSAVWISNPPVHRQDIPKHWTSCVPGGAVGFTALTEQLGLKLVSTRGPVDAIVIDHVEQPSPN